MPDGVQNLDYTALGWGDSEVGVDYEQIIAYLTASIQEQQTIIDAERNKIASIEERISALENPTT